MKVWHLSVLSWIVTALIAVLGVTAASTIWYFQEPVVDSVAQPGSYSIAAVSGLVVLMLSFLLSCGLTVLAEQSAKGRSTTSR
ncbi:hypothetical protein D6T63_11075 [Arthrobacter cheniae]|uniref:Uncharacterized protein n=1 Tax=Arthrobacter cheniae TaxID=1258888 RepID=A0A3A5M234_9MICC|nr:hypothetical protein [Arthrobacter cheniae]RJT79155.1 hypothetical protein D6T63_11075 [Arthrobacter cheniae]